MGLIILIVVILLLLGAFPTGGYGFGYRSHGIIGTILVDGLLGPLTREALTAYQADQGLTTTAAIDEPTLDSLGMG